jgi:outer membrane protein assembly factor BamB
VALLDATGEVRWIKTFGGPGADNLMALSFDAAGDVIATGAIEDSVQFGTEEVGTPGQTTAVAVKLDGANGGVLWARGMGFFPPYHSVVPAMDPQGTIVVTTALAGPYDFGGSCPVVAEVDGIDVAVVKLDPGGECLWARNFPAPGEQNPQRVAVDGAGNIVLGGSYLGAVDFGFGEHTLRGTEDAFLLKLAPSGQPLWSRSFGDATDDSDESEQVNGLGVDAAGTIYLAGSFDGAPDFCDDGIPLKSAGSTDLYIAKYAQ